MTVRPANRPSQRPQVLHAALHVLRNGDNLSLDAVARAAGLTKPGLLYHFPDKAALLTAVLQHVLDGYEESLVRLLPRADPSPRERMNAYLTWALTTPHDAADLVMFSDPRLADEMNELWAERMRHWVEPPGDLPEADRARLNAVRLLAEGCWFADASNTLPLSPTDRAAVLELARTLLRGDGS
ncbi:TetR/AcrR family transcriptional regulator [Nocardioides sp. JQ2195]|uniref:TetR/AcrR family transcriptional regulator n=1 Tax=Nocardioides sp. JQ2195 TaxID=2592334 RepID=UPI00143EBF0C|nr:TetR/AcrR family transcriptional regulator [Nocardioides sp. JQ2195]QIX28465.1 TetR/AcrR family transcriptional regulator [Nocardioides sp. JQ2195]